MIRIDLLPREEHTASRTALDLKVGELVAPIAMLGLSALIIAGTLVSQHARMRQLETSIAKVDEESRVLAPQIARVNQLARERAELDLRMGIINRLEKGRTQSVRLMDELARCVPDHLWLTAASQDAGTTLSLEGVTYSNLVVSDFMSRLERSPMFANVQLEIAERGMVTDKDVVKFRLTCTVTPDETAN